MTLRRHLTRFARAQDGATLVEFALVTALLFLLFFAVLDFARLGFVTVMAEKATERAVRLAVVRPAVCPGLPDANARGLIGAASLDLANGTRCTARAGLCRSAATLRCSAADAGLAHPTVAAVWAEVAALLPADATPANLQFSYSFDPALNRVGATYLPVVTVDLVDLPFDFISPLGALARAAGATAAQSPGQDFLFSSMSAALPAESIR